MARKPAAFVREVWIGGQVIGAVLTVALALTLRPAAVHDARTNRGANAACHERAGPGSNIDLETALKSPTRRVRTASARTRDVLFSGVRRSATLSRIVRALEGSNVIVQIVDAPSLPPSTRARLLILAARSELRLVRIELGFRCGGDDLIALLGHELFHAWEIAQAPEVRDTRSMEEFYRRVGFATERARQYDTDAAYQVQRRIRRELGGRSCW